MDSTIFTKSFAPKEFDIGEIMRYAGILKPSSDTEKLISECIESIKDKLSYKVCYSVYPVTICDGFTDLTFTKTSSENLKKLLSTSDKIVVFAATIGIEADRIIAKHLSVSPLKALLMQAIATERIESLCDAFCKELALEYGHITPRFSPGYGDFSIEHQRDIFRVLDCPRKIGLSLNQSLMMSPSKSVTAIVGISNTPIPDKKDCRDCDKKDCEYRRTK